MAERGPAAHALRAKKKNMHKRGGPLAAPPSIPSVQSKRTRVEEVDDCVADALASQLTCSSKAPVHSVSLWLLL